MAAGFIDNPYYRYNDVLYRWIGLDNWRYSRIFTVDTSVLSHKRVRYTCHSKRKYSSLSEAFQISHIPRSCLSVRESIPQHALC